LDGLRAFFEREKRGLLPQLRERFEAYWPAFTLQIRSIRNEVGHPVSIEPITPESVHAAFLVFPEVASVSSGLMDWLRHEAELHVDSLAK